MSIEIDRDTTPSGQWISTSDQGLRACLESACRKNGYRKLDVDALSISTVTVPRRGIDDLVPLVSEMPEVESPIRPEKYQVEVDIDSQKGSITLYETKMFV